MPRTDKRVLLGKEKAIIQQMKSFTLRDELRDILGQYDLELMYEDEEKDEPRRYVRKLKDGTYVIQFRHFSWRPEK